MTIAYPYEPISEIPVCNFYDGDLYCILDAGHPDDHIVALAE